MRRFWERCGLSGVVCGLLAALAITAAPGTALAAWKKAESKHFVVYSEGSERELRDYTAKLEDFDGVLRLYHNKLDAPDDAPKLSIYLVSNVVQLREVRPGVTESLGGYYLASPDGIYVIARRDTMDGGDYGTIFHEYTHHYTHQYASGSMPAWLVEGYAEYFSTVTFRGDAIEVGQPSRGRAYSLLQGGSIPLSRLLTETVGKMNREDREAFYAQSWLLAHYLFSDPARKRQLIQYTRLLSTGEGSIKAMETATGGPIAALEANLAAYRRGKLPALRLKRKERSAAEVTVSSMPASADNLILMHLKTESVAEADRPAFLAAVRKEAGNYKGDRLAESILADIECAYGDRAVGETALKRLIDSDPNDAGAMRMLAECHLNAAAADDKNEASLRAKARPLLLRAYKIDDRDFRILWDYAQSRITDDDFPSKSTLDALVTASNLAPQVDTVTFFTAQVLMRHDRPAEAVQLLRGLANNPHGGGAATSAKELLAQAEKDAAKKATPVKP